MTQSRAKAWRAYVLRTTMGHHPELRAALLLIVEDVIAKGNRVNLNFYEDAGGTHVSVRTNFPRTSILKRLQVLVKEGLVKRIEEQEYDPEESVATAYEVGTRIWVAWERQLRPRLVMTFVPDDDFWVHALHGFRNNLVDEARAKEAEFWMRLARTGLSTKTGGDISGAG